jgi:SAM-dependent methyltransferase
MESYSFTRYLSAKKSVDDRALNLRVWNKMAQTIREVYGQRHLHLLEIGAGTGVMLRRMVENGLLQNAVYHAIDADPENIRFAKEELGKWGAAMGFQVEEKDKGFSMQMPSGQLLIILEEADLFDFIECCKDEQTWDLLIANAFLDLVDTASTLPLLRELVEPGGWFFFSVNFDGLTILEPPLGGLDDTIIRLYHQSMDERTPGGSRAGRNMFQHLRNSGLDLVEAGSSDWVVFAKNGQYPMDEAYFLRHILYFFDTTLSGNSDLDPARLQQWLVERRAQIERGELVYIAHQLDFLARRPAR